MRLRLLKVFTVLGFILFFSKEARTQSCIPTNISGTNINMACNQVCSTLVFQIPHIKSTDDYTLNTIPYTPYAYTTAAPRQYFLGCGGGLSQSQDDRFFDTTFIPFYFCFYGDKYGKMAIGTNGLISFDSTNALKGNTWSFAGASPIPFTGTGNQGNGPCPSFSGVVFPRASIMAGFSDIFPQPSDTNNYKIEARVEGSAPCRKFVVSFFNIPMFSCTSLRYSSQIILHESTGIIDVFIGNKPPCSWNSGLAILGIQDWSRTRAIAAPGKNLTVWNETNTGYRFTPSAGGSRYVSSELLTMGGVVVATADTATTVVGLLNLSFPNICPPGGSTQYVVRTTFSACENPANQLVSLDTITINRTNSLNATAAATNTACGPPSGTISVTVPGGVGTPPYTYVLDGGAPVTGASPYTFTGVAQGPHTVVVTDASGGCTSTLNLTVNITTVLNATTTFTGTTCSGATNGTITVTTADGTGPYSFILDGGAPQTGPLPFTFSNVPSGPHTVVVTDQSNGCVTNTININIAAGPPIATTATKTDALCNGSATGTITVAQPSIGTAPFEYSLDGTTWQTGNVFTGLAAGTYTVYFREAGGCQGTLPITVAQPTVLATSVAASAAICNAQSNGTLIVAANGGVSPYQYSIDGTTWQAANIFNVPAGNYTVSIRDANGCISVQNATVTEPAVLAANSATTNASCDGGNDGTIVVTATGGNNTYSYSIDGTNFQSSNQFNVAPGNYTVTVNDNLGCTTSFTTTVGLTNNLAFTQQTDPTICESKSTQLQLNSNATQFVWTPATGLSSTTISNPVANPTVTTQYIVTATLGRCSANDTVVVNVNAAPVPNAGPDGFICYGQNYRLQAAGGGTQYAWSPSTYLDNPAIANPLSTPSKDVVYTLSILSDANGCASLVTDDMRIDVTPPIKVKTFPYDTIGYPGDQFQLLAVPSDSDVINYSWNPSIGLSDPTIPNPVVTVGAIGQDVQYQVITSTIAGCRGEGYVKVRVYKGPDIYVPTGFSPNNDGKNDKFTPFPVGMKSYTYFRVFNRWGQLVFSTTKLNDGWDGRFGGTEQPGGVYVWMIEGLTKDNRVITKKGTVMLIR